MAAQELHNIVQDVNPFMQVLSPKARLSCSACSLLGKLLYPPGPLQIPLNPKRSHPLSHSPVSDQSAHHPPNHTTHYPNDLSNPSSDLAPSYDDAAFTLDFTTSQPSISCHFDRFNKDLALNLQLISENCSNQQPTSSNGGPNYLSLQQSIDYDSSNPKEQSSVISDSINPNLQTSRRNSTHLQQSSSESLQPSMKDSRNLSLQTSRRNSVNLQYSDDNDISPNLQSSRKNFLCLDQACNDGVSRDYENFNHYADNDVVNFSDAQSSSTKESYDQSSSTKVSLDHYKKPTLKVELFRTSEKGFGIRILQSVASSKPNSLEAKKAHNRHSTTSPLHNKYLSEEKNGSRASSDINHPTTCSSPNLDHIHTQVEKFSPMQNDDSSGPNLEMVGKSS